jgi:site-specific recombinase XerD
MDELAQRVIRPAVQAIGIPCYGWHGFRRGIASNLYALGVDEKVVQRILRHAKSHVTKDRYIKALEPAVLDAMQKMRAMLDQLKQQSRAGELTLHGKLLTASPGEVAEWLKAAVC